MIEMSNKNETTFVGKDKNDFIGDNRLMMVGGNEDKQVKGTQSNTISGDYNLQVKAQDGHIHNANFQQNSRRLSTNCKWCI